MVEEIDEAQNLAAIKFEGDPVKKFRMYFHHLVHKLSETDGTIKEINIDDLEEPEILFFNKFIAFLKSMQAQNLDALAVAQDMDALTAEINNCKEKKFADWMENKIQGLSALKFRTSSMSEDSFKDKAELFANKVLTRINPDNIY